MPHDSNATFSALDDARERMANHHLSGRTLPVRSRLQALKALRNGLRARETELLDAVRADLGRTAQETFMTELGLVYAEIALFLRKLKSWAKPHGVSGRLFLFPSNSHHVAHPHGVTLIIAPWNFPLLLSLVPLVGAIGAGNCAVLRPSSRTPSVSSALQRLIAESLPPELAYTLLCKADDMPAVLAKRWDFIFFTGSVRIGREVARAAARYMTPVALELGGKSPVIVHKDADVRLAARRIAWAKTLNAGQVCVAPDYLMVHEECAEAMVQLISRQFTRFWGKTPLKNQRFARIISTQAVERLAGYMEDGRVLCGGGYDLEERRVEPTLILLPRVEELMDESDVALQPSTMVHMPDDPAMAGLPGSQFASLRDEIFGPVLPVMLYRNLRACYDFIRMRPNPLALYCFTKNRLLMDDIMRGLPFGGGCINDCVLHVSHSGLPMGGCGGSGFGRYHGAFSFDTFSHRKGIVTRSSRFDSALRYPPYTDTIRGMMRKIF